MESTIRKTLKSLCCSNGWSYGVFWRFDHPNNMLLTLEDAYYEEQMGVLIDSMLLQVHMLGEGIIGQAAFTGKHRWIFSDAHTGEGNSLGSDGIQDIFQDDSEVHHQFSLGIKTIAVISLEPRGVVQFGSTQKVVERLEFFNQTKRFFREMENANERVALENAASSLNIESYDSSGLFASLISSVSSNFGGSPSLYGDSSNELMRKEASSTNFTESSPFTLEVHHGRISPLRNPSHQRNQLHMAGSGAQVSISNNSSTQLQQLFLQSTTFVNNADTPCSTTWSREGSSLTTLQQQFPPEMVKSSPLVFPTKSHTPASCNSTIQNFPEDSILTSLCSTSEMLNMEKSIQYTSGQLTNQRSTPLHATEGDILESSSSMLTFQEEFKTTELTSALSVDDIAQWLASSPEQRISGLPTTLDDDLSQAIGATLVSSGLNEGSDLIKTPFNHPTNSLQSSVTNTFKSDGEKKFLNVPASENDLLDCLGVEFGCEKIGEMWEDIEMPVMSGGHSTVSIGISGISESDVGSMAGPRKGLFSELGIEQLLDEIVGNSSFEDQLSTTKRRKMGTYSVHENQVQLPSFSCLSRNTKSMQPVYNLAKTRNLEHHKEVLPKSQVGLWIDDSYSIIAESNVMQQPKRTEEPAKATKKRARPGESTRPRPKDRQQIQDRICELRKIIPNSAKCSIDSLLDRTIKHMLFLQSVAKYADKLKEADEPKLIGQENGVILKDNSNGHGGGVCGDGGGATWAFEVGGQTMVCPIIVEDLNPPGQMLIEMLCEERGLFLEIADVVRGFGLNILKGVMEVRENKIWARFIVEANRHVTRMDIFWSLIQLLQQTATNGIDTANQPSNAIDGKSSLYNNFQQLPVLQPISLANTFR